MSRGGARPGGRPGPGPPKPADDHVQHGVGEGVLGRGTGARARDGVRIRRDVGQRDGRRLEERGAPLDGVQSLVRALGARAVRPGHIGGLEAGHLVRAELEIAGAGDGRQVIGVRDAEGDTGFGTGEGAQADAVREVGVQTAQAAFLQTLGSQQEVHAQGAADAADLDEHLDEVGLRGEQFAELVDDDDERGERVQGVSGGAGLLVVVDIGEVARLAQEFLTALEFTADGVAHTVDQGEVVGQVGDDGGDVREGGHPGEGGAALEVRQDEVQGLRGVGDGQPQDEGAQEFGLAGAGGADTEAVRAHAVLRGLLEVEHDR